jgi:hypothetical protein
VIVENGHFGNTAPTIDILENNEDPEALGEEIKIK